MKIEHRYNPFPAKRPAHPEAVEHTPTAAIPRRYKRKGRRSKRHEYFREYYLANRERKLAAANDRNRRLREEAEKSGKRLENNDKNLPL